jgi:hypothetical protein
VALLLAFVVVAVAAIATTFITRLFFQRRRNAIVAGLVSAAFTLVLLVALFLVSFGECLSENRPQPSAWPWSPRREFCNSPHSHASLGVYALLLLPSLIVISATVVSSRVSRPIGWALLALLAVVPFLPKLYVDSLPLYLVDDYPILHAPLLRQGAGDTPPRVCYAYGILFGPRKTPVTPETPRTCIDLVPTPEALALTPDYDQEVTIYDLEWVGKNLTAKGLPPKPGGTGIKGLMVERSYTLSGEQARESATRIAPAP